MSPVLKPLDHVIGVQSVLSALNRGPVDHFEPVLPELKQSRL